MGIMLIIILIVIGLMGGTNDFFEYKLKSDCAKEKGMIVFVERGHGQSAEMVCKPSDTK